MERKEYWDKKKYGITKILYDLLCKTNQEVVWINEHCIGFKMNEFESFIIRINTKNKNDLDFQYELAEESAREKMYNEKKKHEEKMRRRKAE